MKPYYQDEWATIYHGDCREILPTLPKVDLVLTDPPYGIGEGAKATRRTASAKPDRRWRGRGRTDYETTFDDTRPSDWVLGLIQEKAEHLIIFGGNYFSLPPSSCWLVWDKLNGASDFADCELAWTNLDKAVRKISYLWNGFQKAKPEDRKHPTQKPLEVISWAILQAPETCRTILDPVMGSGTTLVAAKNLNRKAIGIELEEKYCEIAAKRLAQRVMDFSGVSA